MSMWTIMEEGRDDYGRGFGMRDGGELEEAYREGCRHGYEKAMREARGGMGFREEEGYGNRDGYGSRGGYGMGERRMMPGYPEPMYREMPPYDGMGERRRRRSNGEFY